MAIKRISSRIGYLAVPLLLWVLTVSKSDAIVYFLDPILHIGSGYTADGSITTDGTIGELTSVNFVDWSITLVRPMGSVVVLTQANSSLETIGVEATATTLSFDGSMPNFFGSEEWDIGNASGELDLEFGNGAAMEYTSFMRVDGISSRVGTPVASLPNPLEFARIPEPTSALLVGLVGLMALFVRESGKR